MVFRPRRYGGDTTQTLAKLVEHEAVARLGLGFEMALIVTGALAAVWFYKLFREINPGMFLATSLAVAADPALAPARDAAAVVGLMGKLSDAAWGMAGLGQRVEAWWATWAIVAR